MPITTERLDLPDAEIVFAPGFLTPDDAHALFAELRDSTPWQAVEISVWAKRVLQPRLTCWFGDPDASYRYSGTRLQPEPWTPTLLSLRERIETVADAPFNSVLLNLYRDRRDSVGWHSDNEPELGERPTIASLSLGATRTFLLRHRTRKELPQRSLPLAAGDLLLMSGGTQRHWSHAIRKETRDVGPRINLTFRRIVGRGSR